VKKLLATVGVALGLGLTLAGCSAPADPVAVHSEKNTETHEESKPPKLGVRVISEVWLEDETYRIRNIEVEQADGVWVRCIDEMEAYAGTTSISCDWESAVAPR
jgi:hypothetical protein